MTTIAGVVDNQNRRTMMQCLARIVLVLVLMLLAAPAGAEDRTYVLLWSDPDNDPAQVKSYVIAWVEGTDVPFPPAHWDDPAADQVCSHPLRCGYELPLVNLTPGTELTFGVRACRHRGDCSGWTTATHTVLSDAEVQGEDGAMLVVLRRVLIYFQ